MSADIKGQILAFIQEELVPETKAVDETTRLFTTRVVSSRNLMHLVDFIETTFGIQVEPLEMVPENFDSANALAEYIERKRA